MKIPESFTINTQLVKIEIVPKLQCSKFGEYNSITDTIKIAETITDEEGETVTLTEEQKLNTFIHELLHVFQWHANGETDETQSSTYAGYIIEFLKSSGLNERF